MLDTRNQLMKMSILIVIRVFYLGKKLLFLFPEPEHIIVSVSSPFRTLI